jgi:hypothetical protein
MKFLDVGLLIPVLGGIPETSDLLWQIVQLAFGVVTLTPSGWCSTACRGGLGR